MKTAFALEINLKLLKNIVAFSFKYKVLNPNIW